MMLKTVILIYLIVMNIVTFFIWGIDKFKAKSHARRISEKCLLILSACGGFIGAIAGMSIWHHKTIKSSFLRKFRLIVLAWIAILVLICYFNR